MNEGAIWSMYYSGLVAIRFHPKNDKLDIAAELILCSRTADAMMLEYLKRFGPTGDWRD